MTIVESCSILSLYSIRVHRTTAGESRTLYLVNLRLLDYHSSTTFRDVLLTDRVSAGKYAETELKSVRDYALGLVLVIA